MSLRIQLQEPGRRPREVVLDVQPDLPFVVWALPDGMDGRSDLRVTVLRASEDGAPPGAWFVFEGTASQEDDDRPGRDGGRKAIRNVVRVTSVGEGTELDAARGTTRSRIGPGFRLLAPSRIDVTLSDGRRFELGVDVHSTDGPELKGAIASSQGARALQASRQMGAIWLVPTLWTLLTDWQDEVDEGLREWLKKLGLNARVVSTGLAWIVIGGVAAFAWWQQKQATDAALAKAQAAQEELARASSTVAIARKGEVVCLQERQLLVQRLGDVAAARALRVDEALAATSSQGLAVELGGSRMADKALLASDAAAQRGLRRAVIAQLAEAPVPSAELPRCLAFETLVGAAVPRYGLVWSGDPAQPCAPDRVKELDDRVLAGRWALSDRVVREFGTAAGLDAIVGDGDKDHPQEPRLDDRWSAQVLATGLLVVQKAVLTHPGGGRPPVNPSQAQAWSLALWSAYNTLPVSAGGTLDGTLQECVGGFLDDVIHGTVAATPGEPVLPDLTRVLDGKAGLELRPTAPCPWRPGALEKGAQDALAAIVTLASIEPESAGEGP